MAMDISAVGSKVVIDGFGIGKVTISEFSDEGTPFDAPDIDASENKKNLNGTMISSRTPAVFPFAVTVIPGSVADQKLSKALMLASIQPGGVTAVGNLYGTITVTIPATYENGDSNAQGDAGVVGGSHDYVYSNARIKNGPTGPTTSSEGRLGARTYTFEAEGFKPYGGK